MTAEHPPRPDRPQPLTLERLTEYTQAEALANGVHPPQLHAEGNQDRTICGFVTLPELFAARRGLLYLTGVSVARQQIVGVLQQVGFITEAWLSQARRGQAPHPHPAQDPHRREILMITLRDVARQETTAKMLEYVRDASGRLTAVVDITPEALPAGEARRFEAPLLDAFIDGFVAGGGHVAPGRP